MGISALFGVAVYLSPNAWFLAFALSPQCFFMLPFRQAMYAVLMFNAVAAVVRDRALSGPGRRAPSRC